MGQAQLLLIVLGVVIVGIAIMAGIQAYSQNNEKADLDAVAHEALRLASDVQVWAQKPVQFGGGATIANLCNTAGALTAATVGWQAQTEYSDITGGGNAWTLTSRRYPARFVTLTLADGSNPLDGDTCDPEDITSTVN